MGRKKGAGPALDFRCVYDKAALGIAVVDLEGRILDANPAFLSLFGYSAAEIVTRTVQDLSHADDYAADLAQVQQLLAGAVDSYQMEKRYYRQNGQLFWGDLTVSLVRSGKGKPKYIVATVTDISERKRVQIALEKMKEKLAQQVQDRMREAEENEALYRSLFEHAAIGIARVYPDSEEGTISHTNKAVQNFLGYSDAEMETLTVKDLSQREDFDSDQHLLLEMVAGQRDFYQIEKRYFRKDGRMVWGLLTVSLVRDSEGNPAYTACTVQDITARKEAEEGLIRYSADLEARVLQRTRELEMNNFQLQAEIRERRKAQKLLQESEERFRQIAENIREVFWLSSVDKNEIFYISPGYEAIWDRTCESLYQEPKSWLDAIHPEDRARVLEAALTRQESGEYQQEYRIVRPDGTVRWILDRAFPVRDGKGRVYRIAGIAEDITARKNGAQAG